MPDHTTTPRAVFLSYAREDAEATRRIADALRAFGVEVWFDQNELRGGDSWDQKIRTQIRTCTLCIPVISAATQSRGEGYFRREWKFAVERTHDMATGVPFLLPIVIDDTAESAALVPEEFMRVQWTRLAHGVPTPQFIEQVRKLLENPGKPVGSPAHAHSPMPAQAAASQGVGRRVPAAAWIGAVAAILIVAGVIWWRQQSQAPEAGAGTRPPTSEKIAETKPAATPSVLPKVSDKSIAVLPFTNMSEDKDNAFFADGIQEDILTNLALIREFRVVSRTSVMPYRTTTKSIRQIAQELGVTYILEGSVQRAGNKVRVTGQLIQADKDEHLWAKAYDRDLSDIFAIQSELSQQIAAALKTALSPEEKILIARRPTDNPAAYDLFLRGRDVRNRQGITPAAVALQTDLLQHAVDLDPNFAQAWGELAAAYAFAYFTYVDGGDAMLERARKAIERAVQLAPNDPEIIGDQGTYYYYGYRDYTRANEFYEQLARLQPNSPSLFNSLALIQRRQGHWAQSLANSRRAVELDPGSLNFLRVQLDTQKAVRRWDDALATQRRIMAFLPEDLNEAYKLAYLQFLATGSTAEGEAFFAKLSPEQLNSPFGLNLRKTWAAEIGDNAEVVRLDKVLPYYDEEGTPHSQQAFNAALALYATGDQAGAKARLGDFPAELHRLLAKEPRNVVNWIGLAGMEFILGHSPEALRCIGRAGEILPESRDALDSTWVSGTKVLLYDWMGDKERALAEYARLLQLPQPYIINVHELQRDYSTLHGDPRFEALLKDPKNNAPLF